MHMIGRNDRDGVNPVRPLRFRRGHFHETSVSPLRRDVHLQRRRAASFGIGGQCPRHQLKPIIHPRRNAVYRPNERSRPAANHPQPQPPPRSITRFRIRCHISRPIQLEQAIKNFALSF